MNASYAEDRGEAYAKYTAYHDIYTARRHAEEWYPNHVEDFLNGYRSYNNARYSTYEQTHRMSNDAYYWKTRDEQRAG